RPEDDPNHYQPSGDLSDMHPGGHGNTSGHDLFDGLAIDTSHLDGQLSKAPPPSPHAPNFRAQRAKLVTARSNLVSMVSSGQWSMEVIRAEAARIERELAAIDAEERALSAEASADTVENRKGALSWLRSIVAQWGTMGVPARRAALAMMLDGIRIGPEGIAVEWSDAATMAVRYAEGRLPEPATLDQTSDDPRRPARPMLPGGADHGATLPPEDA
ncbi:hypothetical protein, partial [Polyangium sp. 15x6]|uniref:hypothetical protein n=1 Tax=Polyangium sp. 15x6 TaxID=3042687 RepID=UPI00249AC4A3